MVVDLTEIRVWWSMPASVSRGPACKDWAAGNGEEAASVVVTDGSLGYGADLIALDASWVS